MSIKVDVSVGEFIDKLTILVIKSERIKDSAKLENIKKEKSLLETEWDRSPHNTIDISSQWQRLLKTNNALWDIEDAIREKEKSAEFDDEFIELARAVYITNDKRAEIKKEINTLTGSSLVEEKSYSDYQRK